MRYIILNFSHPITVSQMIDIKKHFSHLDNIEDVRIPCQLDLSGAVGIRNQVDVLIDQLMKDIQFSNEKILAIVPPAQSTAAYWMGILLSIRLYDIDNSSYYIRPKVIWMQRSDNNPSKFYVGGIE